MADCYFDVISCSFSVSLAHTLHFDGSSTLPSDPPTNNDQHPPKPPRNQVYKTQTIQPGVEADGTRFKGG